MITPSVVHAAEDPYAAQLFKQNCASCHEVAAAAPGARIPPVSLLKAMTPPAILRALEIGVMRTQAAVLSTNERQAVANFLGTPVTIERRRDEIANACPAGAGWKDAPGWSNWGAGLTNMRFQTAKEAGLRAEDLPKLTVKWAFAFPDTAVLRSQQIEQQMQRQQQQFEQLHRQLEQQQQQLERMLGVLERQPDRRDQRRPLTVCSVLPQSINLEIRPWNFREFVRRRNEPPQTSSGLKRLVCVNPDGTAETTTEELERVTTARVRATILPAGGGMSTAEILLNLR